MSCIHCANKKNNEVTYPCLCDSFIHPDPLNIAEGLNKLPRQIATFPQFRRAMLHALRMEKVQVLDEANTIVDIMPLQNWRARDKDDLGIMLLEMWAYICDAVSFYDEVIANELYLRTSFLRPNLRKLVGLLGYLPRPAIGSSVYLAALAEGRLLVRLSAGTAFRSGAFNGNPPQVFELEDETSIHPLVNRYSIKAPHYGKIRRDAPHSLLINPQQEIKEDMLLLLVDRTSAANNKALVVNKFEKYTGEDKHQYTKISFTSSTSLKAGTLLGNLRLMKPGQSAGLCLNAQERGTVLSLTDTEFVLNTLTHEIKAGDFIIATYHSEKRCFHVKKVSEVHRQQMPPGDIRINGSHFSMPGVTISVTKITLDTSINYVSEKYSSVKWNQEKASEIIVHFGMQPVATVIDEPDATLSYHSPLYLDKLIEKPVPAFDTGRFLLQDKNTMGADISGKINYESKTIVLDQGVKWNPELTLPVEAFGNVVKASRGEKVPNEKLGSGDASVQGQTFKLKKKPLTYFMSPTLGNDQLVKSTLTIHVNGIRWKEVNSFFGQKENDQVYIVRQNDDGESIVTFGDGVRGQRLPSGVDNIIGNYRFGAEAASPPPGSVNQVSKAVKGLQSVKNHLAAFGGADTEDAENLRMYAPKSALILGRVVSINDMEALAGTYPGVRTVQATWQWDTKKQRATAHIFYIGDTGISTGLSKAIRSFSDPSTPITVVNALASPLSLSLDIQINPRYNEQEVLRLVRNELVNKQSGLLAPENIGISQPLYRSRVFDAVLKIDGTMSVQGIFINSNPFNDFAVMPGTGYYFDIEKGKLIINGKEN